MALHDGWWRRPNDSLVMTAFRQPLAAVRNCKSIEEQRDIYMGYKPHVERLSHFVNATKRIWCPLIAVPASQVGAHRVRHKCEARVRKPCFTIAREAPPYRPIPSTATPRQPCCSCTCSTATSSSTSWTTSSSTRGSRVRAEN